MTIEKVELGSACTEEDRIALERIARELSRNKGRSKCKVANAPPNPRASSSQFFARGPNR